MITPEQIRQKAQRKYREVLQAYVRGDELFPWPVRADRSATGNPAAVSRAIGELRTKSREGRGFGYDIRWEERRSRQFGRNPFPAAISIATREDFLKLIGKNEEFRRFAARIEQLRAEFPELGAWLEKNVGRIVKWEFCWAGLIEVLAYFREHPSPGVFARELPLAVDSKFVENHAAELRPLLELVLPPSAIDWDESEFDRRFGLRPFEAMIRMRFLDAELQTACGVDTEELGLPVDQLRLVNWPVRRVFIVENARCLLTLPAIPGALGLFGHGYRVSNFRRLEWLENCEMFYWGDVDVQGFEILSDLRGHWPHTKSLLMNVELVSRFGDRLSGDGKPTRRRLEPALEADERQAWEWCHATKRRIEQERVPREFVDATITQVRSANGW
ncbi:MAG: Wadjet anti-phage system protein JetD domain-containing protein [Gammaproteobacteria bacterium]